MKRSQIKRRPMADSTLKSLEPEPRDYQERDSHGLYFRVKPSGTKSWVLRYKRPNGKWAWMGLGGFPQVSGKAAREEARRLLQIASDGVDLKLYKEGTQAKPLFRVAAENLYQRKLQQGRSASTTGKLRSYLDSDILPVLGDKPLDEVTRQDCAQVQKQMEDRGAHTAASKVRIWINEMFSLAIAEGLCEMNPASELKKLSSAPPKTRHYPHLKESELPDFLKALAQSTSNANTLILINTVLLTASRPGMARWAEWSEFDLEDQLWTVPASKMKMKRSHLVPLPNQLVEQLKGLREVTGSGRYLFPGYGTKNPVISDGTINSALRLIGYKDKLVGHGARHTASTLLREHGWNKEYVETQLAHVEGGVAGIYNKAEYLPQRRKMMQWYADYLYALERGTKVPPDPV